MFVKPPQRHKARALARGSARSRPAGAPHYYLGRPASLWLNVTRSARQVRRTPTFSACGGWE